MGPIESPIQFPDMASYAAWYMGRANELLSHAEVNSLLLSHFPGSTQDERDAAYVYGQMTRAAVEDFPGAAGTMTLGELVDLDPLTTVDILFAARFGGESKSDKDRYRSIGGIKATADTTLDELRETANNAFRALGEFKDITKDYEEVLGLAMQEVTILSITPPKSTGVQ